MIVEFGWFLDRAPWAYTNPGLNRVRVGRKGLVTLLQTRLGLTRPDDVPNAVRVDQYAARLRTLGADAWFGESFGRDPWSTAAELLAARDDAVANGWAGTLADGTADDGGASPLLRTLAAAERADAFLAPSLADDLVELLAELDASPLPLGIDELRLAHPESTFPEVWQRLIAALRARSIRIGEAPRPDSVPELTVLSAETEWEAAEHTARWLAAGDGGSRGTGPAPGANAGTAVVCSDSTAVLDQYLTDLGQPRLGVGERSAWRAQDQIIPLFFELVWAPVDVHQLAAFLTLPDSPVKARAGRHLVRALREEPGVGGQAWAQAIAEIGADPKLGPELAAQLDTAFSTGLLVPDADGTVPGASLVEAAGWFAKALTSRAAVAETDRLKGTAEQLRQILAILAGLGSVSRQDLRRIIAGAVTPGSASVLPGEAAPWLRLGHLAELGEGVDDAVWWGFESASLPGARRWDAHDSATLAAAGVHLPTPEQLTELGVAATLAAAGHCRRLLVVHVAQKDGERVDGNPLLEALVARQPNPQGLSVAQRIQAVTVKPEDVVDGAGAWSLAGRGGSLRRADVRVPVRPAPVQDVGASENLAPTKLSFTQLSSLLGCSLQWALRYRAGLQVPDAAQIPEGNRMLGSFAHKVVEVLHGQLRGTEPPRAVPEPHEVRAAVVRLMPHFASELLLPGQKARRLAVEGTIEAAVLEFFRQLQRGGVVLQEVEKPIDKELVLRPAGRELRLPVTGRADAVGIDTDGRTVVVDLKWANRDKYKREEVQQGEALQLALYQWAFSDGETPPDHPSAYYLLKQGTFASAHPHFGAPVQAAKGPAQLWGEAVRAAEFTVEEVLAGRLTAAAPAEAADDGAPTRAESAAAAGRLYVKPGCAFCDFAALCGLKGDLS